MTSPGGVDAFGDQLDIFDLIPAPKAPASEPVTHLRKLPDNYARVATAGRPWEWIVSRDHVIHGAGYAETQEEAEADITRTLDEMKEK